MRSLIHLAHFHVLKENRTKTEFVCSGCNEKGDRGRYECAVCGFYLHARCAKAPEILKKCTKHSIDGHHMELNYVNVDSRASSSSSSPPLFSTCESCRAPVTSGLFYRCNVCFLTLHMPCAASSKPPQKPHQPQNPQAQHKTTGRKRKIAKTIVKAMLVWTAIMTLKGVIAIATGGSFLPFDGLEFSNLLPDCSDSFDGGDECEPCDVPQEPGTGDCYYECAGDDDEFDFGCEEEEDNDDYLEDWEYRWD